MEFSSADNGKTWTCTIRVQGNYSSSKEDAALNYWSEFKPKRIQQVMLTLFDDGISGGKIIIRPMSKQPPKKRGIVLD